MDTDNNPSGAQIRELYLILKDKGDIPEKMKVKDLVKIIEKEKARAAADYLPLDLFRLPTNEAKVDLLLQQEDITPEMLEVLRERGAISKEVIKEYNARIRKGEQRWR